MWPCSNLTTRRHIQGDHNHYNNKFCLILWLRLSKTDMKLYPDLHDGPKNVTSRKGFLVSKYWWTGQLIPQKHHNKVKGDVDDRIVKSIFSWGKLWKKVLRGGDKLQFQSYNRLGGLQKNICPNTSNPSTGVLLNAIPLIADWGKTFPKSRNLEWYGRESHMFCGLSQW